MLSPANPTFRHFISAHVISRLYRSPPPLELIGPADLSQHMQRLVNAAYTIPLPRGVRVEDGLWEQQGDNGRCEADVSSGAVEGHDSVEIRSRWCV